MAACVARVTQPGPGDASGRLCGPVLWAVCGGSTRCLARNVASVRVVWLASRADSRAAGQPLAWAVGPACWGLVAWEPVGSLLASFSLDRRQSR